MNAPSSGRGIWMLTHDIGQDSIQGRRAKAHQAAARLDYGATERRPALGNTAADIEAKEGAACHPCPAP
eukprot:6005507-Pyramimonas_sp.AAC.1